MFSFINVVAVGGCLVNKQDFLQVFQGSEIEKIEDNLTSVDPLSYTTTIMIPSRPGKLSERLLTCKNPPHSFLWSPDHKNWTDRQVSNSSTNYPPKHNRRRGVTITWRICCVSVHFVTPCCCCCCCAVPLFEEVLEDKD